MIMFRGVIYYAKCIVLVFDLSSAPKDAFKMASVILISRELPLASEHWEMALEDRARSIGKLAPVPGSVRLQGRAHYLQTELLDDRRES